MIEQLQQSTFYKTEDSTQEDGGGEQTITWILLLQLLCPLYNELSA